MFCFCTPRIDPNKSDLWENYLIVHVIFFTSYPSFFLKVCLDVGVRMLQKFVIWHVPIWRMAYQVMLLKLLRLWVRGGATRPTKREIRTAGCIKSTGLSLRPTRWIWNSQFLNGTTHTTIWWSLWIGRFSQRILVLKPLFTTTFPNKIDVWGLGFTMVY